MLLVATCMLVSVATARLFTNPALQTLRVAHQERGILTLTFNPAESVNRSLQLLGTTQAGHQPGWLHKKGGKLYSISRDNFPDNSSSSAGIFVFDKHPNGQLEPVDTADSHGEGGVFLDTSPDGKLLSSVNIEGSTVSIFPVNDRGGLDDSTYVFQYNLTQPGPGTNDSQVIANPHAALFDPSGEFLVVPDRGSDRVYIYQVHGPHHVQQIKNITFQPGTGPRHVVFSPQRLAKGLMFIVGELDNMVDVFLFDTKSSGYQASPNLKTTLEVTHLQSISTLVGNDSRTNPDNKNLASEISISHDGRFLYVSNRNTETLSNPDTLGIFSIENHSSETPLRFLGLTSTYGKTPRHFSLSPDKNNQFVAIANQVTNDLFILERDVRTGFLKRVLGNFSFGAVDTTTKKGPMCVIWD